MKKIYTLLFFIFIFISVKSQAPCTLSLDSIYLDTVQSNCNHLYFKYKYSGGTVTSYKWSYGDGNECTCIKPKNFYTSNGNFQVCGRIQDGNGCADSMCITVNVYCQNPCDLSGIGIYSIDSLSYSCNEFEFITITSNNVKKVHWDFGDGDSSDTKYTLHTYNKNGDYKVRLIINDSISCADTADMNVNIDCQQSIPCMYTITGLDTMTGVDCFSKTFDLKSNKTPKLVWWNFADNNSGYGTKHSQHVYKDTGTYLVCVYAEDSVQCRDSFCLNIQVKCDSKSSLAQIQKDLFKMYPQPFHDELNIESLSDAELLIYNLEMQVVANKAVIIGKNSYSLAFLEAGIYFIVLESTSSSHIYKLIKQ